MTKASPAFLREQHVKIPNSAPTAQIHPDHEPLAKFAAEQPLTETGSGCLEPARTTGAFAPSKILIATSSSIGGRSKPATARRFKTLPMSYAPPLRRSKAAADLVDKLATASALAEAQSAYAAKAHADNSDPTPTAQLQNHGVEREH